MPKYWGKQIFTHWSFPEVGQKEKGAKVGNNNGQLRIATPPRVAHAKPKCQNVKKASLPQPNSTQPKVG